MKKIDLKKKMEKERKAPDPEPRFDTVPAGHIVIDVSSSLVSRCFRVARITLKSPASSILHLVTRFYSVSISHPATTW